MSINHYCFFEVQSPMLNFVGDIKNGGAMVPTLTHIGYAFQGHKVAEGMLLCNY